MITYNWELGFKILLVYTGLNVAGLIPLGLAGAEKRNPNRWDGLDALAGIVWIVLLGIPLFF
jgi:hypothetical protein